MYNFRLFTLLTLIKLYSKNMAQTSMSLLLILLICNIYLNIDSIQGTISFVLHPSQQHFCYR